MSERRDIPDALRDAVDRTVRATVDRSAQAQDAVGELADTVDQVVKGAEKNITRSGKSMRAAVEDRLPATQEDVKALRTELRRIAKRLDKLEAGSSRSAKPKSKPKSSKTKSKPKR